MRIISSRENFWDAYNHSSQHVIREVNLNDTDEFSDIDYNSFISSLKNKKVLLLVHGYNNHYTDVCEAYGIIKWRVDVLVSQQYDEVIGYIWPGSDSALKYGHATREANAIKTMYSQLIIDLSNTEFVDIMSHSMGCYVNLAGIESPGTVRNLFLQAAAVDNESIEIEEEFHKNTQFCEKVYVFHSRKDSAVNVFYTLYNLDKALGANGPENPLRILAHSKNVKVIDCSELIYKHGDYKYCNAIYTYIRQELDGIFAPQFCTLTAPAVIATPLDV